MLLRGVALIVITIAGCQSERTRSSVVARSDPTLAARVRDAVEPLLARYANPAVVVAVVTADNEQFFGFGRVADAYPVAPDRHTRFEIGSITKVFTGLALADMVSRGEVALDDAAQQYLPANLVVPQWPGRPIMLRDLATHTSGLSELAWNNPYRRRERGERVREEEMIGDPSGSIYTREHLAQALPNEVLARPPGSGYAYSSLGYGLLGIALSERAGVSLATLLRERVSAPLGLEETQLQHETSHFDGRFAEGHNQDGSRRTYFRHDEEAVAACCGLRSSASDLARLVRAQFATAGRSAEIGRLARSPQQRGFMGGLVGGHSYREQMGLGWHIMHEPPGRVFKFGRMSGYVSIIDVDTQAQRGVVVLAAHEAFPLEAVTRALLPRPTLAHTASTQVRDPPPTQPQPMAAWDAGVELLSAELSRSTARPGERTELRERWFVRNSISHDLTLFVHADGQAGRIAIEHSSAQRIRSWPAGHVVEQVIRFVVPADYPAGSAQFWLGFYDAEGRAKVSVGDTDGNDRVRGPELAVTTARGIE
jgi:D-alanyl-D-alanine-carboxypeptidase/D-alanyl-D-alanine-endopeptidase